MLDIEKQIIDIVRSGVKKAFPECGEDILSEAYLDIPKEKKFGDFSANIAMRLSRILKKAPFDMAVSILDEIKKSQDHSALIKNIRIEKPGFINFYLSDSAIICALKEILSDEKHFGLSSEGKGKKIQIEFVSANPTGPLTVAHGRQAAIGDSLARIFEYCGYKADREYYINDEGVQMGILARSVKARFMELSGVSSDFPTDGYKGGYIYDIAREIKGESSYDNMPDDRVFMDHAYDRIMSSIKKDLADFGVTFNVWFSQKKLSESGKITKALDILREKGFLYEKDGATWLRSTDFGDDKDRVVIKNDGSYTYLAPDIAYHKEKFEKQYDVIINIWGPDHHGYVNRIKAACQALGFDKNRLYILISQLVTLYRDRKPVRMSTREGEFVTLRQVIDEVGKDAGRFFFIMRKTDSHLDFDLELAKAKTMDNPVYYIQYAHARISSAINFSGNVKPDMRNLDILDKEEEMDIIKMLINYPSTIKSCIKNLEPFILLAYLQDLAKAFHSYYDSCRFVTEDKKVTGARIALIHAVRSVFSSGLTLLGVSAPEKM
jgi:arginyl-tRNA synthetase